MVQKFWLSRERGRGAKPEEWNLHNIKRLAVQLSVTVDRISRQSESLVLTLKWYSFKMKGLQTKSTFRDDEKPAEREPNLHQ